tara:strand:- start:100 stop:456 length:357 start_codon:yes stop_codon:yes gene_type:complete
MKQLLPFILILVGLILLNNKLGDNQKHINEGFTQCEYRKKAVGNMCKEKWGEPPCNEWKPVQKIKKIEEKEENVEMIPLRGYQMNSFMYEIDYEREEGEGVENEADTSPRGVHSSFFP